MFRDIISETPFTSSQANVYFNSVVQGEYWRGSDATFLSTLRALLAKRKKQEDPTIRLSYSNSNYSSDTLAHNSDTDIARALSRWASLDKGEFNIHDIRGTEEEICQQFRILREKFTSCRNEFTRVEKVSLFYRKSFAVECFINQQDYTVMLFVENLTAKRLHYLQCGIFAMMPWYFDPTEGVTKSEMALIEALKDGDAAAYINILKEIADDFDFREAYIKSSLSEIEKRSWAQRLERVEHKIHQVEKDITGYNDSIRHLLASRNELLIDQIGIKTKMKEENAESELIDYFLCNKKIELANVAGDEITFVVKDYVTYFDEDMVESVLDNEYSYVYDPGCDSDVSEIVAPEDMKKLMTAIFIDQSLHIKFCAAYTISLGEGVRALRGYHYGVAYNDCMPNPHTDRYECLGTYLGEINDCLSRNDTIGAIEQCVASCKSLNFGDSTVMEVFMSRLYNPDDEYNYDKCIELPDGRTVNIVQAIAWMKEQDEKDEEKEEKATETVEEGKENE